MLKEHWEELVAQVEAHGHDAVVFLADDEEFDVQEVMYEDGLIKVMVV